MVCSALLPDDVGMALAISGSTVRPQGFRLTVALGISAQCELVVLETGQAIGSVEFRELFRWALVVADSATMWELVEVGRCREASVGAASDEYAANGKKVMVRAFLPGEVGMALEMPGSAIRPCGA